MAACHCLQRESLGCVAVLHPTELHRKGGREESRQEAVVSSTQVRQWGCPHLAQVSSGEGGSSSAAMEPVGAWGPAQTAAWMRGERPPPRYPPEEGPQPSGVRVVSLLWELPCGGSGSPFPNLYSSFSQNPEGFQRERGGGCEHGAG